MKVMKRFLGPIVIAVVIGVVVSLNTNNYKPSDVSLSNIAALSQAQAESFPGFYCMLISLDDCCQNMQTGEYFLGLFRWA